MTLSVIKTERLILRQWRAADRAPFAALNADPAVMEHFPALQTRAESDAAIDRQMASIAVGGSGFMALELKADGVFLGFVGVKPTGRDLPFGGGPEIGWRLARHAWGRGYASEAARAALADAFRRGAERVVSFTATTNTRSQAVMARIGLQRAPELDFDHPALAPGHRLQRHVVYAAARGDLAG
ncbi:MAG: GNAT family N-acetyltransferase [Caulobacteraceae bacterium]|nr:GNAT family N-acetyltransferase [Caulobacter sp.]